MVSRKKAFILGWKIRASRWIRQWKGYSQDWRESPCWIPIREGEPRGGVISGFIGEASVIPQFHKEGV